MKRTLPDFLAALVSKITPFKNLSALLMILLLMSGGAWGQVTITNPNNTTPAMSATYGSLALAIADVNNRTAISGPITITLDASTPQTAPAGGYSITAIPTGASSTNKIIFDGGGNTITAPTPQTSGNLNDAIFKIIGADFITIQNFTMQENAANTTTAASTNNMTEFGVALFYASPTNGAQNNIIQNNTITLNRAYQNTFGIFASSRTSATAVTTAADATTAAGANSNNKIYSNTISNINYAIVFIGSSTIAGMDTGNDIGGSSSTTGNIISNFCTSSATAVSTYTNLTGSNYAIFINHNLNSNVSYNTITSAISTLTATLGGILQNFSTTTALGTTVTNTTLNNNTVTLSRSAAGNIFGVNNQGVTTTGASSSVAMNNNQLLNVSITITGTSAVTGFTNSSVTGVLNMNGNTVRGITSAASAGGITGVSNTGAVITSINMDNNKCGDATAGFVTFSAANSGAIRLAENTGGASTCAVSIQNNDIRGITYSIASSATHTYITSTGVVLSNNMSNNTFTNLALNTTGSVTFFSHNYTMPASGTQTISGNSIVTGFSKTGAGGTVTIATSASSSPNGSTHTFTNNNFSNITVTGATGITGVTNTDGSASSATRTVTGNTFNNWTGGTSAILGLSYGYIGGTTSSISTNTLTNITSQSTITAISIGSTANLATTLNVANNTINNLSSTGTGGQVLAISCSNTSTTININGNAINNLSSSAASSAVGAITVFGATTTNVFQNVIYDLSTSGTTAPIALGIQVAGGTLVNVYRNKVYNLSASGGALTSSASAVSGIYLSGGTTVNTFNNLIGNLTTPNANLADAIRGINIVSTSASTSYNVYNNSVYLTGGSSGTNFGSSGIYHTANSTASTAKLDLQNNMILNTCIPSGTGIVTAFRRSAAATLGNYATSSNKNLFYAGTPSASTTIMSDGTNNYQTVTTFQTAVSNRDANSFTESTFDPATYFVSTTGSNANYLQPVSGLNTQAEGGGNTITMCSPDYNGVTRPGFSGAAYDLGAWEFAGVSPAPVLTNITPSPALTTQCTKAARVITIDITTASGTITGATLNYNHNGTAQTAVTMTNSSGNTWTGTMLAPSTGNATVTWSITATNSLGLNTLFSGTSYADEPNTGITATATATPSTVCDGSNASLSVSFSGAGSKVLSSALTATTASSYSNPIYSNWANNRSQILILGSELTASGILAGNITSMSFPLTSTSTTSRTGYTIKIGSTNTSALTTTSFLNPTFTSVYSANYIPVVGTNTFNFTTPFVWDGISNIVIETCWDNTASTATESSTATAQTTTFNSVISFNRSSVTGVSVCGAANTPLTAHTNRPLITFSCSNVQLSPTVTTYSWSNGTTTLGTTNPLSTPIANGLTYTATATVNGCPMTAAVTPTVNPLPTAPTATNSSQCGAGIPTASVADNNSYTTPTFKWYSAASGGTALQTSTSTTYTTSINATTTFYVAVVGTNTCESARTAVTVTVTQPDAISANTSAAAICLGQSVTLTAANTASTPTQNYTYSWICSTTGSGATSANTSNPASITPTAAGSYTYTVTGTDGACSAVNTVAVTVNALPNITSATATPSAVCSGAAITLTGASVPASAGIATLGNGTAFGTGTTGTFLRQGNTVGNQFKTQYLFLAAELQAAGLSAGNITGLTFDVYAAGGGTASNLTFKLGNTNLTNLTTTYATGLTQVYTVSTYPASGSVQTGLQSVTFNTPFNWDGSSNIILEACSQLATIGTDGTLRSTTTSFTSTIANSPSTTACSSTTGGGTFNERPNFRFNGQVGTNLTSTLNWSWNSTTAITTATGSTTETNTGASAITKTYTVTATNATSGCTNSATTSAITINPATAAPTATNSSQCGSGTPTCSVTGTGTSGNTFKWYTVSTGGTAIVGQSGSTLSSYPINATTSFYVSEFNGTCESARTQVDVTVTNPPAITASASLSTVCSGSPTVLSVTSANSGYTYDWSNSLGSGASVTASPTSNTTYTVTATDSSGGANNGCSTTATVAITTNALPSAITLTPSSATNLCLGDVKTIVASGGNIVSQGTVTLGTGTTTLSTTASYAAFNGYRASSWIQTIYTASELSAIGLAAGNITSIAYNINSQGSSTSNNITIKIGTISASNFATTTLLSTSAFTTVYGPTTYTHSASGWQTINFATPYNWDGVSNIVVDVWQDGPDSSSDPATYFSTTSDNKVNYTWNVTPSATPPTGNSTTSRFNVKFTGNVNTPQTISWSPTATLYTDAAATNAYTGNPTTVYAKPTTNTTYTATATTGAGCTSTNTLTVNVNPTNTVGTASSTPTLCANSLLTNITHSTTGATGIGTATGLPAGVTAAWASNAITISGTPTASGTFNYSIPLTGGCGSVNATGTITVNPKPNIANKTTAVCNGLQFSVVPTNGTDIVPIGTTYTWNSPSAISGITGLTAGTNTTAISGTLTNSTSAAIEVVYQVTPSANVVPISSPVTINFADRLSTYSSVNINGQGNTASVTAGSTVNLSYSFAVSYDYGPTSCPGCVVQSYIGIGGTNQTIDCQQSIYGGSSGNINATFTAPTSPGVYYLTQTNSLAYSCSTQSFNNNPANAIGVFVVGSNAYTCTGTPFNVTVTVNPEPTALVLSGSLTCTGATGTITSSTSVSGVNYQLFDSSNATVGTAVSGTGSALTWSSIAIGTGYYVKATNATTTCVSSNSNAVAVGTITDKTWLGTTDTSWNTASNWSCGTLPSSSDVIVISSGLPVLDTNFTVGATGSLTLSGTGTLTINSASTLTIAGTADFGGKAVTIKSDATGNGAIGQVTGTLSGATNVTVERYIPAKRSWRALTAPVTMATSINANWQQGGTANTTNGFDIWDPNGGTGIITGGVGSSLLEYSSSANTWSGITNTTAASSMMTGSVNKPFMAFVTGPYGSNNIATGAAVTTLKATGTLLTGDKTYATTANKYAFIGNPYASPLNLTAMLNNTSNATASFGGNVWVWDANVLGTYSVGTYNLFDFAASNYSNTSNNANISGAQIQSGQAFFVKSTDGASFTIKEAHKGSVFTNAVFRSGTPEILRVNLFKQVNNEWAGRDGAMEVIFSDAAADQAPNKMANGSENIAFTKNGALFASEHHLPLVATDVLKVKVWNTIAGANYKLKINTEQFTSTNLNATLEDLFTNSRTPLTLDGSMVEYPFTVTTDALSSGDRFRIVFQNAVLGTNNPTANGFSIVPNPVTGDSFQVNLGTLATGNYSYSICNAIGQEVEKGSIQNATQNTNYTVKFKENAATGIYIMKIKGTDNSVFTAKIIKK